MIDHVYRGAPPFPENTESTNSVILGVNYSYSLSEKLDFSGSAGYGFGFKVIPLKADFNYGITNKISANLGMGIYMISDSIYEFNSIGVLEEGASTRLDPSTNEFGINFGLSYQITPVVALGVNYNMLKNDGEYDFNGMSFGLSYAFGGKSKNKTVLKKPVAPKQPVAPNNGNDMQERTKETNALLKKLEQAQSELVAKKAELNRLSNSLNTKDKELKLVQQKLEERSERVIELEMKEYLGVQVPVIDMHSFGSAFNVAVKQFGSSKEQKFWWHGNVYTTEKR